MSTQLYETELMLIFAILGVELGAGCFSFHARKPTQRAQVQKARVHMPSVCPTPTGENRRIHRATMSVKGCIPHCCRHQGAADLGKGIELSRWRGGFSRCNRGRNQLLILKP